MTLHDTWAWAQANPIPSVGITVWILASVLPRPHPADIDNRALVIFWTIVDRLCFLTARRLPGKWKWLLTASPEVAKADATLLPPGWEDDDEEPEPITRRDHSSMPPANKPVTKDKETR